MRCAAATLAVLLAAVGAAAGSEDVVWEEPVAVDDEEEAVVEIDAVTSSHQAVPRPAPAPRGGGRTFGCIQLRMVPDYDGHSILVLTFLRDGRCGQAPEEVTPPNTP